MRLQPSARGGWHTEGEGTAPASQVISQHLSALHSAGATFAGALGGSSNEISVHASGSSTMREARELTRRVVGVSLCRCRVSRLAVSVSTVTGQVYLYTLFYATGLQGPIRPCRCIVYTHRVQCLQCLQRSLQCLRMSEGSIRQGVHDANH